MKKVVCEVKADAKGNWSVRTVAVCETWAEVRMVAATVRSQQSDTPVMANVYDERGRFVRQYAKGQRACRPVVAA